MTAPVTVTSSAVFADTLRIVLDDYDIPADVHHRDIDQPVIRR